MPEPAQQQAMGEATTPSGRRTYWALGLVILIVLATSVIRLRLSTVPLDRDEGEYAYMGQLMLKGIPPYAEAYNLKMPGIYAIYALILAAFGQTPTGIHLGLLAVNAATTLVMYVLATRLFTHAVGVVASAAFAAMSLNPRLLGLATYAEHFVVLAMLLGTLLLVRAVAAPSTPLAFWSGVLFGLAFVIKQSGGFFALFGVFYLLVARSRHRDGQWWARLGTFVLGSLAPLAATGLGLYLAGVFDRFLFWTVLYAYQYASATSLAAGVGEFASTLKMVNVSASLSVGAIGLAALMWEKQGRRHLTLVVSLLICSLLAASAGLHFRPQYFILLLPVNAMLAGIGAGALSRLVPDTLAPRILRRVLVVLVFVVVAWPVYADLAVLFELDLHGVSRVIYQRNPFPESVVIGRFIKDRTSTEDRVAVIGSEPQIYFYADRRPATGYIYTYALMETHKYASAMQREMIQQIEAADPKVVVFVRVSTSWLFRPESDMTLLKWFVEYRKKFVRVGFVDIVSPELTTYRWGHEALNYTPQSDVWLEVFERKPPAHE